MAGSLVFDDSLEFMDWDGRETGGSYWFEALADGASSGDPQPIEVGINSLMRDGAIVTKTGDGNRESFWLVRVKATGGDMLDDGIAALHRATGKRTTLVWTPPDGLGPVRVWDVETSNLLEPNGFDDLAYVMRNEQVYRLRLVCQPFRRGVDLVSETAEAIPSVGTIVNAGTSLTGWSTPTAVVTSGSGSSTVLSPQPASMLAVDSGAVAAKSWEVLDNRYVGLLLTGDARQVRDRLTLTQAISAPSGGYLSFEVKFDSTFGKWVNDAEHPYQDGGTLDTFTITTASATRTYKNAKTTSSDLLLTDAIVEAVGSGWTRYTFQIDAAMSVTSLAWNSYHYVPYTADPLDSTRPRILVRNVALAETATLSNQVLKTINVGGSARTTGALVVSAPTDATALGKVLAFTVAQEKVASGWRPDLAQWVLAGASTSTIGGRAGVYDQISAAYGSAGSPVFQAPASMFLSGAYTACAPLWAAAAADFTVEASLLIGATVAATQEMAVTTSDLASVWAMVALGTMYLPPLPIQYPTADVTVRFRFKGAAAPALANMYVFPVEGDLTIIDCGASSHLWIDAPSPEQPQGGYWRGSTQDRANAVAARTVADLVIPGVHTFNAGPNLAFVASLDAQGPSVSFDHYEKFL